MNCCLTPSEQRASGRSRHLPETIAISRQVRSGALPLRSPCCRDPGPVARAACLSTYRKHHRQRAQGNGFAVTSRGPRAAEHAPASLVRRSIRSLSDVSWRRAIKSPWLRSGDRRRLFRFRGRRLSSPIPRSRPTRQPYSEGLPWLRANRDRRAVSAVRPRTDRSARR